MRLGKNGGGIEGWGWRRVAGDGCGLPCQPAPSTDERVLHTASAAESGARPTRGPERNPRINVMRVGPTGSRDDDDDDDDQGDDDVVPPPPLPVRDIPSPSSARSRPARSAARQSHRTRSASSSSGLRSSPAASGGGSGGPCRPRSSGRARAVVIVCGRRRTHGKHREQCGQCRQESGGHLVAANLQSGRSQRYARAISCARNRHVLADGASSALADQ